MARNTTMQELVEMLRDEIRSSSNTSRSLDNLPYLKRILNRYNATISDEYEWPYMNLDKANARVTLAAGQRYYDFPEDLSIEHIEKVWYKQATGSGWTPVYQGIGGQEYAEFDSDEDQRDDSIGKWDFVTDEDGELQFEIWPMPASDGGLVWFEGKRKPTNLMTSMQARANHDDHLIVLRAATEALRAKNKGDSDIKASAAGDRFSRLTSRLSSRKTATVGGKKYSPVRGSRIKVLVARSEMGE